jgi:alkanesulfonate monooxygenase SsuD/methylene tetrahydromethanopterin reductase-like flavin-dependent oxidoreductase (luciferase family)
VIKFGVLPSPQYTTWSDLRWVAETIDTLGLQGLWISDHLVPPYGSSTGPVFEAFTTLAAWSVVTRQVTLGTMVAAAGFRTPSLTAKMITMIDQLSNGRAVLGIGAGWFELEHRAFGFPFASVGERLDRLDEALTVIRPMLRGSLDNNPAPRGGDVPPNLPPPVQHRIPILIGSSGERKGLRLVAVHADIWNVQEASVSAIERLDDTLRGWCSKVGRNSSEIERSYHVGLVAIRDSRQDAERLLGAQLSRMGVARTNQGFAGSSEALVERLIPYVNCGFRNLYFDILPPYDVETLHRLTHEVRPLLADATPISSVESKPTQSAGQ